MLGTEAAPPLKREQAAVTVTPEERALRDRFVERLLPRMVDHYLCEEWNLDDEPVVPDKAGLEKCAQVANWVYAIANALVVARRG